MRYADFAHSTWCYLKMLWLCVWEWRNPRGICGVCTWPIWCKARMEYLEADSAALSSSAGVMWVPQTRSNKIGWHSWKIPLCVGEKLCQWSCCFSITCTHYLDLIVCAVSVALPLSQTQPTRAWRVSGLKWTSLREYQNSHSSTSARDVKGACFWHFSSDYSFPSFLSYPDDITSSCHQLIGQYPFSWYTRSERCYNHALSSQRSDGELASKCGYT